MRRSIHEPSNPHTGRRTPAALADALPRAPLRRSGSAAAVTALALLAGCGGDDGGLSAPAAAARLAATSMAAQPAGASSPAAAAPYVYTPRPVIAVAPTDSDSDLVRKAAMVTPTAPQYDWQRMELTGFVHFSVNTSVWATDPAYQNNGTGSEDPMAFNPVNLDPKVWLQAFKDAGFKEVILTAKHHNGFHIWPASTTRYSVASSLDWKGGKGDVVKAFADAARTVGIRVGFYLSPADLHEGQVPSQIPGYEKTEFIYGSGKKPNIACQIPKDASGVDPSKVFTYTVDEYNCFYMRDLYELLTQYGKVSELWFDGFNPYGNSRPQPYSTDQWVDLVNKLQPGVVTFNSYTPGQLLTWVGNESGVARAQAQWSVLPANSSTYPSNIGTLTNEEADDRGSRAVFKANRAGINALWWAPAESDTTLSSDGSWFYNPGAGTKSLATLMSEYFTSVGRNSNYLLNIGPRADGTMAPNQLALLKTFGQQIRGLYQNAIAVDAQAAGSIPGHPAGLAVDDSADTYWSYAPDGRNNAGSLTLTVKGGSPKKINLIVLQEDIRVGQRVERFDIQSWNDKTARWDPVAIGEPTGTIGYKRILYLKNPLSTTRLRINVTQSRSSPAISNVALYSTGWNG
ncbi:alpha-L-fucosidase [Burkholderia alba]|uniref:alpha-L-fucosidase n=1 Tax=Burkholderia alba TaxID=2683677 RepID=UPI002B055069|nr:alpha-L-fucosidase [Burkholderia alba]